MPNPQRIFLIRSSDFVFLPLIFDIRDDLWGVVTKPFAFRNLGITLLLCFAFIDFIQPFSVPTTERLGILILLMTKSRKIRSDIRVGSLEKKLGLEAGAIRNPDGSDARSDKKLSTLRKEFEIAKTKKVKTNPAVSAKALTAAAKAVKSLSRNKDTNGNKKGVR
jgi:hypothetical protein